MYVRTVDETAATGLLREMYDKSLRSRGAVPNLIKIQSLRPEHMNRGLDFIMPILFGESDLTRLQRELLVTTVCAINRCRYCTAAHLEMLGREAQDEGLGKALVADYRRAGLSDQDRRMIEFAEKVTLQAATVQQADIDALKGHGFSDEAIVDMVYLIGWFNCITRVVDALGIELDTWLANPWPR